MRLSNRLLTPLARAACALACLAPLATAADARQKATKRAPRQQTAAPEQPAPAKVKATKTDALKNGTAAPSTSSPPLSTTSPRERRAARGGP